MIDLALLTELGREPAWAVLPGALEPFFVATAHAGPRLEGIREELLHRGGVAVIPVDGVLLRQGEPGLRRFGVANTGHDEIEAKLSAALADPGVDRIVLAIDSPGGVAQGTLALGQKIAEANKSKRVTAHVSGTCASAAYWLASQSSEIVAERDALVGSIGAMAVVRDVTEALEGMGIRTHVLRTGPHKGMGVPGDPITGDQLAQAQRFVDCLADDFFLEVARGRGMELEEVLAIATGATWHATEAKDLGLVDRLGDFQQASGAASSRSPSFHANPLEDSMSEPQTQEAPEVVEAPAPAAQAPASLAELREAFPNDPAFVLEQLDAGATIQQATEESLRRELARAREELDEARARAQGPATTDPIAFDAPAAEAGGGDFHELAKARAEELGITYTQAAKALASENPSLHRAWVKAQRVNFTRR